MISVPSAACGNEIGHHAMQVVALAFKKRMLFDVQHNIQIARRPAKRSRFAQAGETNARAVLHSRRHLALPPCARAAGGLRLCTSGKDR